jgi:FkbM family methyltransferase
MQTANRKLAFVLAASAHGPLIVNRLDHFPGGENPAHGLGLRVLETAAYEPEEIALTLGLLQLRRQHFGDGVVAIDCGANIGVHTIEWAKAMTGWGTVLAIEAQERLFYALAGNIALNNCFNARAMHAAAAAADGMMRTPVPDYQRPSLFASVELRPRADHQFIGQTLDYERNTAEIRTVALDGLGLVRVDLIKLDIEGMEQEALAGARRLIAAHRPILIVEWFKSPKAELRSRLEEAGYRVFEFSINFLAVHTTDACLAHVRQPAGG